MNNLSRFISLKLIFVLLIITSSVDSSNNSDETINIVDVSNDLVDTYNPFFIFMSIVYIISTVSAIITNLIVILVYILGHRAKTELSIFLVNLAVADFLMSSFCMPFTFAQALLKRWIFGEIMCPIVLFKQVLTVSLSIYTMVAIGIDRYFAIKCPLKNRVTHKKGKFSILIVWIISVSLASVQLFVARIQEDISYSNSTTSTNDTLNYVKRYTCNEVWDSIEKQQTYTLFNFFAVYLIPVFILGYTYSCIACIIKQTTHPGNADVHRDMNYNKSKNKVVKMLILLVCVFTMCWLPLHAFTLIKDFTTWLDESQSAIWYYYSAHWLAMANCTINPIIYGYSSKNFRSDVYALVMCCRCLTRREWMRQESTKTTSLLFKRFPKNGKMGYYNNNLNLGVGVNTSFLARQQQQQQLIQDKHNTTRLIRNTNANRNNYQSRRTYI
ncbi:unnamed protein product [Brachionus calyciflorus]|uniref:G-protein coupled receptors family 1 profile domain-containing protein n=1 Tax=Brachionus calyciflorus TaxID=104777 RepID=A0A813W8Y9_9BILA|nr:unnamed protein product [Brachionus calyciflorus]